MCFRIKPYISTVSLFPVLFISPYLLCCSIYSIIIAIFSFLAASMASKVKPAIVDTTPKSRCSEIVVGRNFYYKASHMCTYVLTENFITQQIVYVCLYFPCSVGIWYWITMNELDSLYMYVFLLPI